MEEVIRQEIGSSRRKTNQIRVAVVAHDGKKGDLVRFVRNHCGIFKRFEIAATGTTGGLVQEEAGLEVERLASGPMGGDLQIGARIAEGNLDALIFLRDPLTAHPHEPDIQALLKVCDIHDVPVATNLAAAEVLIHFLDKNERDFEECVSVAREAVLRRVPTGPDTRSLYENGEPVPYDVWD